MIKEKVLKKYPSLWVNEHDLLSEHPKDGDGVELNTSDIYNELVPIEAIDLTLAEVDKEIERLKGNLIRLTKRESKWKEEVGKVIDDFCFSDDKYDNIEIKREIKQKIGT